MKMKTLLLTALTMIAMAFGVSAQSNAIKGTLDIKYNTRSTSPVVKGVNDVYTFNINVANSALFRGTITDTPQIIDGWVSKKVVQPRSLKYDVNCDVVNPKNPAQTRNVGRMFGSVPISSDGIYHYDTGTLEVAVLPMGNAGGFTSKFGGTTQGKPLVRPKNWLETLKSDAVSITRKVGGKTMTVVLNKYDKMTFFQHVIAAGPVQIYQPVTANGEMLYDYDKNCWFFNNVTIQYADAGVVKIDRLSGTIRWDKATSEYQFDVRVNEAPPGVAEAFEAKANDESSFFETDTTIPALTGTMKYKDQSRGDITLASNVTVDLTGNNINKQQLMAVGKILLFSMAVPMNAD